MRSKRDIKMGRLCTPGVAVLGIVGGGVTFSFLNGEAILDENMLFWVRLYALVVVICVKFISISLDNTISFYYFAPLSSCSAQKLF